jgi:hypothetical protein
MPSERRDASVRPGHHLGYVSEHNLICQCGDEFSDLATLEGTEAKVHCTSGDADSSGTLTEAAMIEGL